jgi:hypothetical protein
MRTTINIVTPIPEEPEQTRRKEGGSLDERVSRLDWVSKPMRASLYLADKGAVCARLDEDSF